MGHFVWVRGIASLAPAGELPPALRATSPAAAVEAFSTRQRQKAPHNVGSWPSAARPEGLYPFAAVQSVPGL